MTDNNPSPVPPPGSEAARKAGCTCRLYDPEWLDAVNEVMFSVDTTDCPLHEVELLRPRPDAETGGANRAPAQTDGPQPCAYCGRQRSRVDVELRRCRCAGCGAIIGGIYAARPNITYTGNTAVYMATVDLNTAVGVYHATSRTNS